MELQGKVIAVLPERSGVSARGEWKAQSFVIETHEQYPKKLCFDVFGADRLAQFNIQSGEELLVSFDLDAHEYNGRWFNSVRAWNIQRVDPNAVAAMQGGMQPVGSPFPPVSGLLRQLLLQLRVQLLHSLQLNQQLQQQVAAQMISHSKRESM